MFEPLPDLKLAAMEKNLSKLREKSFIFVSITIPFLIINILSVFLMFIEAPSEELDGKEAMIYLFFFGVPLIFNTALTYILFRSAHGVRGGKPLEIMVIVSSILLLLSPSSLLYIYSVYSRSLSRLLPLFFIVKPLMIVVAILYAYIYYRRADMERREIYLKIESLRPKAIREGYFAPPPLPPEKGEKMDAAHGRTQDK